MTSPVTIHPRCAAGSAGTRVELPCVNNGRMPGAGLAEHYVGDDTNVRTLLAGVLHTHAAISVDN